MTTFSEEQRDVAGGWSDYQIREFARRFAKLHKLAWHAYVADVREALVDSFVLLLILGQDRFGVAVEEIRSLRTRLGRRLADHHAMANPVAELAP